MMETDTAVLDDPKAARLPLARMMFGLLLLTLFATFCALGIWQVDRLRWKLDLIARVDARVVAAPMPPPSRAEWPSITAAEHEYRHVQVSGTFDYASEVLVQASTERGPGFWVMTPLRRTDGTAILVNRGFVPTDRRRPADRKASETTATVIVTGLLRLSEPKGGFLRNNDAIGGRWFSRDVMAIAQQQRIDNAAPYFIDADATSNTGGLPVGGLTVIRFANSHLVYAITWFCLALMVAGAGLFLRRSTERD
jgi:surfeit locus 1 family protein